MIFDDSAGESQSIKLRADGEVPSQPIAFCAKASPPSAALRNQRIASR
jgi:hypothetical protein